MLRTCFRTPIQEIFQAAKFLQSGVDFHLEGDYERANEYIISADMPIIGEWVESVIGKKSPYIQHMGNSSAMSTLAKTERVPLRMPNSVEKQNIHIKYGYCCQFCGIPVIRREIRDKMRKKYPNALRWGKTNASRHNAFFALWVQYDHIVPHARGGNNSIDNMILTCTACNYWRGHLLLEEVNIAFPRNIKKYDEWNGLENFI